jgi:hypothetical protein
VREEQESRGEGAVWHTHLLSRDLSLCLSLSLSLSLLRERRLSRPPSLRS